MPKKKDPPEDPKAQHERFKEVAREIGADESGKEFERVFGRVVPSKAPKE
jgi:hypothetical protein